jgi:hypothetical protein
MRLLRRKWRRNAFPVVMTTALVGSIMCERWPRPGLLLIAAANVGIMTAPCSLAIVRRDPMLGMLRQLLFAFVAYTMVLEALRQPWSALR